MKKSLVALALAAAFALPAYAQTAAPAAEASPHTLTGNLGLFSSYRFRGIDQTFGKPALQGGFDYAHTSGFYVGNWNSNVSESAGFPDGNLEMDLYGGYKLALGDVGLDFGAIYYYYPGSEKAGFTNPSSGKVNGSGSVRNGEIYIGASWKFLSMKYSYAVTDYFSLPDTSGSSYLEFNGNYDLGNGWGVNGHLGSLWLKDFHVNTDATDGDYIDWKLGVTKDINGFVVGLAYVDSTAKGSCDAGNPGFYGISYSGSCKDLGRGTAVLSLSKTF
ncbi:MAG: TorF family putative porin [Rhodocyclaceae bacterium]|nr:TorF family putative porin [Rhodocyclaceae bacterium]